MTFGLSAEGRCRKPDFMLHLLLSHVHQILSDHLHSTIHSTHSAACTLWLKCVSTEYHLTSVRNTWHKGMTGACVQSVGEQIYLTIFGRTETSLQERGDVCCDLFGGTRYRQVL